MDSLEKFQRLKVCHPAQNMRHVTLCFLVGDTIFVFLLPLVGIFSLSVATRLTLKRRLSRRFNVNHVASLDLQLAFVFFITQLPVQIAEVCRDLMLSDWTLTTNRDLFFSGLHTLSFAQSPLLVFVYLKWHTSISQTRDHLNGRVVTLRQSSEEGRSKETITDDVTTHTLLWSVNSFRTRTTPYSLFSKFFRTVLILCIWMLSVTLSTHLFH